MSSTDINQHLIPLNQYANMDYLLKIYSEPKIWKQLYEKIEKEYKTNPEYLSCVDRFKIYKHLIKNEPIIYFKLTRSSNKSRRFQYKLGLNVDVQEFKPSGCCSGGGLYFCELKDIYQFTHFGKYLTPIIVPKNIPIYKENHSNTCDCNFLKYNKFKAPVVFTLPRIRIDDIRVSKLLSTSSEQNKALSMCHLYKSDIVDDLQAFVNTPGTQFWINERIIAHFKLLSLNVKYNRKLKLISYERLGHDLKIYYPKLIKLIFGGSLNIEQQLEMHLTKFMISEINKHKNRLILDGLICHGFPLLHDKYKKNKSVNNTLNLNVPNFLINFNDKVLSLFEKFNMVVAGSFVLRYITRMKFRANDIDLYMNIEDFNKLKAHINKDTSGLSYKLTFPDNIYTRQYNMTNIELVCLAEINVKNNQKYNKYKFQIIVTKNNPEEFIKSNFDFDLCSIGFNFQTKTFFNNDFTKPNYNIMKIQDSYISKMSGADADSYSNYRATKTTQRLVKYIERGFYIENWREFLIEIRDKLCAT